MTNDYTDEFFKMLGRRHYLAENKLSDITYALLNTHLEFRDFFMKYFIGKKWDELTNEEKKKVEFKREYQLKPRISEKVLASTVDTIIKMNKKNESLKKFLKNWDKGKLEIELEKEGRADIIALLGKRHLLLLEVKTNSLQGSHIFGYPLSSPEFDHYGLISNDNFNGKILLELPEKMSWQVKNWEKFRKELSKRFTDSPLVNGYIQYLKAFFDEKGLFVPVWNRFVENWKHESNDKILKIIENPPNRMYFDLISSNIPVRPAMSFQNKNYSLELMIFIDFPKNLKKKNKKFFSLVYDNESIKNKLDNWAKNITDKHAAKKIFGSSPKANKRQIPAQRFSIVRNLDIPLPDMNGDDVDHLVQWACDEMLKLIQIVLKYFHCAIKDGEYPELSWLFPNSKKKNSKNFHNND